METLKSIGVLPLGHRVRILRAFEETQEGLLRLPPGLSSSDREFTYGDLSIEYDGDLVSVEQYTRNKLKDLISTRGADLHSFTNGSFVDFINYGQSKWKMSPLFYIGEVTKSCLHLVISAMSSSCCPVRNFLEFAIDRVLHWFKVAEAVFAPNTTIEWSDTEERKNV